MKENLMLLVITIITVALIFLLGSCVSAEAKYNPAKNYYEKYKDYKERYKDLKKDYDKLEDKYEERGIELESYYMDLIQCQRVINGDNPWEFMINK